MSKGNNKFGAILSAAKSRQVEPEHPHPPEPEAGQAPPVLPPPAEPLAPPTKQKGRPRGKRSDPAYEQVTAYIRRETYRKTKIALLQRGDQREFSELVEALLNEWLDS